MRMDRKKTAEISILTLAAVSAFTAAALTGCGSKKETSVLDPENPVSLTIWHYYNGTQQTTFDELVEEFNSTVGKEEGVSVEGYSKGSVSDLELAVTSALNGEVGAEDLPDIFSSYADTAYSVQQEGKLADLTAYFTEEELSEYVDNYVEEGYLTGDDALYLIPVAKSTEILMLDTTDWEPFAEATGASLDDLATVEGVTETARLYYEWTDSLTPDVADDGKAFYGRDSMSNYFVIGMRQMGTEIFEVEDGVLTVNTDKEKIRRLWDNYYVPYVKGYFASVGKFRSDDVKTGELICYTGSTSSSFYFPDSVETDEEQYDIEYTVLAAPVFEDGENVRVQQGAGMAVTKSDEQHEYAACVFLKWFTEKENNLRFVCDSGYMPVKEEANSMEALDKMLKENGLTMNDKAYSCLETVFADTDAVYYTSKCSENGYSARKILDYNLSDRAAADKAAIDEAVLSGTSRGEAEAGYLTDEAFEEWYEAFCTALDEAAFAS